MEENGEGGQREERQEGSLRDRVIKFTSKQK